MRRLLRVRDMLQSSQLVQQAKAALKHADRAIESLRVRLEEAQTPRQRRLIERNILHDLEKRHSLLSQLQSRMACSAEALPSQWHEFLTCSDDFLEAERRARLELIGEEMTEITRQNRPPSK